MPDTARRNASAAAGSDSTSTARSCGRRPASAITEEPVEIAPDGQLSLFDAPPVAVTPSIDLPPPLEPLPTAALHVPRALSYSALALHDRCGFSYYAERVIGLRPGPAERFTTSM